jgi:hypothetical protein
MNLLSLQCLVFHSAKRIILEKIFSREIVLGYNKS